jgi:UrcA family protein
MKRAIVCAALAASALMGAMTAAQAEDGQMRVKVGDLNLSTTDGARTALARIEASANTFCDVPTGREQLERAMVEKTCVADMTRKGVERLHAPIVTILSQGGSVADRPQADVTLAAK